MTCLLKSIGRPSTWITAAPNSSTKEAIAPRTKFPSLFCKINQISKKKKKILKSLFPFHSFTHFPTLFCKIRSNFEKRCLELDSVFISSAEFPLLFWKNPKLSFSFHLPVPIPILHNHIKFRKMKNYAKLVFLLH